MAVTVVDDTAALWSEMKELSSDVPGVRMARDISAAISVSVELEEVSTLEETPELEEVCDKDEDLEAVGRLSLDPEWSEGSISDHMSLLRVRLDSGSCAPTFFAIRRDPTRPVRCLTVVVRFDRRGGGCVLILVAVSRTAAGAGFATPSATSGFSGVNVGGDEKQGAFVAS